MLMNKMLCTNVLISETFNVKIMLNKPRINNENMFRAKSTIAFGLSHRDVKGVLICICHNKQIMPKVSINRKGSVQ